MKNLFLLLILMFGVFSDAQCKLTDIAPFALGSNRFIVTQNTHSLNLVKRTYMDSLINAISDRNNNGWTHYKYLKNDSIFKIVTNLNVQKGDCFFGDENTVQLCFADDVLYKIKVQMKFDAIRYDKMLAVFSDLRSTLNGRYKYSNEFIIENGPTNENIGTGYSYYNETKRDRLKIKETNLSYTIQYKNHVDKKTGRYIPSSDAESYNVELTITDLHKTKLTGEEY